MLWSSGNVADFWRKNSKISAENAVSIYFHCFRYRFLDREGAVNTFLTLALFVEYDFTLSGLYLAEIDALFR
jgi:hypothetical protein